MRKELYFLGLITLIVLVTSCQSEEQNTNPTFRGGTSGLSIEFASGAPPDFVFDNAQFPFPVEVILLNLGEATVKKEDILVRLSGINPTDFGSTEASFRINGIEEDVIATIVDSEGNIIDGPPVYVSFPQLNFQQALPGNNEFPVRADVCYTYQTQAYADGCIRADVLSVDPDAVCQVNERKQVHNSGAPIQVQEFIEMPSGSNKIRYVFKIKHVGKGRVYLPTSKCPLTVLESRATEDRLHFKIQSGLEEDLQCHPLSSGSGSEGDVRLIEGEATVTCSQQTTRSSDFIDKLKITLSYDYKDYTQTTLLVKKSIN